MNIIVTGSNGFVGSELMWKLEEAGHKVTGIDISDKCDSKKHSLTVPGDIRDIVHLNNLYQQFEKVHNTQPDLVIHCAAAKHDFGISREEYFSHNEKGTAVLLNFMEDKAITKLINISSVSVFGHPPQLTGEKGEYNPDHPYGESKLAGELLSIQWQKKDPRRELVVLRPAVIYGPYNFANVYKLIDMMHRKPFLKVGSGNHIKAVVSISTVVDMIIYALSLLKPGYQHFNSVDRPYITLAELMKIVAKNPQFKIPPISIPPFMAILIGYLFDVPSKLAGIDLPVNSDRMRKLSTSTPFKADKIHEAGFVQVNTIEESIKEMTDWYLKKVIR